MIPGITGVSLHIQYVANALICFLVTYVTYHLSGIPGNAREFDSCQRNVRELPGKNFVRERRLLLASRLWQYQCLVA